MIAIYKIENLVNHRQYVGSTINLTQRKKRHFKDLKNNAHHSKFLQRDFNKCGIDNFEFSIIEPVTDKNILLQREQYWLDTLKPVYNNSKTAGNCLGVKHSAGVVLRNQIRNSGYNNGNAKIKEENIPDIISKSTNKSTKEMAKEYNVSRSSIERLLKRYNIVKPKVYTKEGKNKLAQSGSKNLPDKSRKVIYCDSLWNEIKVYNSLTLASEETGFSIVSILKSCKGITGNYHNKRKCFFKYQQP